MALLSSLQPPQHPADCGDEAPQNSEPFMNMLVFVLHLEVFSSQGLSETSRVLGLLSDCSVVIELTAFTFKTEQRAARYTKILFLGRFLHSGVFAKIFKFIKNAK